MHDRRRQWEHNYSDGLLKAAGYSRAAAQALLDHIPPGRSTSNLYFLLHESGWNPKGGNHYDLAIKGKLLEIGLTGKDAVSLRLAGEAIKIVGDDMKGLCERNDNERLQLVDRRAWTYLEGVGKPLGTVFAAHIDEIGKIFNREKSKSLIWRWGTEETDVVNSSMMAWALLPAVMDDQGFKKLIQIQAEHMRHELKKIYTPEGAGQGLADPIKREGTTFGYLLELRRRGLLADGREVKATNDELRDMVASGIGLIPVPGFDLVGKKIGAAIEWTGKRTGKAFDGFDLKTYGEELGKDVHKDAGGVFDKSAEWVAEQFSDGKTLDESYLTAANDWELVQDLMLEMIATDLLVHGELDSIDLPKVHYFLRMARSNHSSI